MTLLLWKPWTGSCSHRSPANRSVLRNVSGAQSADDAVLVVSKTASIIQTPVHFKWHLNGNLTQNVPSVWTPILVKEASITANGPD